jgi:hypothetical protein
MTLQEGLDYCNIVLAKDQSGNTLSPVQYNTLLKAVNDELFEDKYLDFVKNKALPIDLQVRLLNSSPIKKFVTNWDGQVPVAGKVNMPTDARYPAAIIAHVDGEMRNVELHDEISFNILKTSVLHRDVTRNPIAIQRDRRWEFIPNNVSLVDVAYFRDPSVPYYDTAIDANDNIVYLQVGYYLVETATPDYYDVYYDNGVASVLISSGVYYDKAETGGIGTVVQPLTTELEWERSIHVVFFNKILERMGINVQNPAIPQYTNQKNAENKL